MRLCILYARNYVSNVVYT